jgi:hypothetical protein
VGIVEKPLALKARNDAEGKAIHGVLGHPLQVAPSALPRFIGLKPGPMAQAFTFRAFGAEIQNVSAECC